MGLVRGRNKALLGALVTGALATGTCGQAAPANASCFSAFGLSNGNGCTSNLTSIAVGIGQGAVANAGTALFGGAIAIGNKASVDTSLSAFTFGGAFGANASASTAVSLLGLNLQFGPGNASTAGGILDLVVGASPGGGGTASATSIGVSNISLQIGPGSSETVGALNLALGLPGGGAGKQDSAAAGLGNISAQIGTGSAATLGALNLALSVLPNGTGTQTTSAGVLGTSALNLWGDGGSVSTQSILSPAVNILGSNNVLVQGILSAAASVLGTGNTVSVTGPAAVSSLAFALLRHRQHPDRRKGPAVLAGVFPAKRANAYSEGPRHRHRHRQLPPVRSSRQQNVGHSIWYQPQRRVRDQSPGNRARRRNCSCIRVQLASRRRQQWQ